MKSWTTIFCQIIIIFSELLAFFTKFEIFAHLSASVLSESMYIFKQILAKSREINDALLLEGLVIFLKH